MLVGDDDHGGVIGVLSGELFVTWLFSVRGCLFGSTAYLAAFYCSFRTLSPVALAYCKKRRVHLINLDLRPYLISQIEISLVYKHAIAIYHPFKSPQKT